jgi:hypothetical protein
VAGASGGLPADAGPGAAIQGRPLDAGTSVAVASSDHADEELARTHEHFIRAIDPVVSNRAAELFDAKQICINQWTVYKKPIDAASVDPAIEKRCRASCNKESPSCESFRRHTPAGGPGPDDQRAWQAGFKSTCARPFDECVQRCLVMSS